MIIETIIIFIHAKALISVSIPRGSNLLPSFLVTAAGIRSLANNLDEDDEKHLSLLLITPETKHPTPSVYNRTVMEKVSKSPSL